ncbi:hypothetical protein LN996_14535 [Arthrobacter sp. AK01]|nr:MULTISPECIES: hypothetical protein [Micrococcaceae]MCD4852031.1 hypothetical protein [Arthrobacter sp. AK01]
MAGTVTGGAKRPSRPLRAPPLQKFQPLPGQIQHHHLEFIPRIGTDALHAPAIRVAHPSEPENNLRVECLLKKRNCLLQIWYVQAIVVDADLGS